MAKKALPPFINSHNAIPKILDELFFSETPEKLDWKYLNKLGFNNQSSEKPFINFAKRIGLLEPSGEPTPLYRKFKNSDERKGALMFAIKKGYRDVIDPSENLLDIDRGKFCKAVTDYAEREVELKVLKAIYSSFRALVEYACKRNAHAEPQKTKRNEKVSQPSVQFVQKTKTILPLPVFPPISPDVTEQLDFIRSHMKFNPPGKPPKSVIQMPSGQPAIHEAFNEALELFYNESNTAHSKSKPTQFYN